jgi:hypothetical protein
MAPHQPIPFSVSLSLPLVFFSTFYSPLSLLVMPFHMFERESECLLQRPDSPNDFGLQFTVHQRIKFKDKELLSCRCTLAKKTNKLQSSKLCFFIK